MAALLQFPAQFQVIVDLAVKDDDGIAIRGYDGLIAAVDVDDLQARRAQRDGLGLKDALLIRAAMSESGNGTLDAPGAARDRACVKPAMPHNSADLVSYQATYTAVRPGAAADRLDCRSGRLRVLRHSHLRHEERSVDPVLIPDGDIHQRIEQRVGEIMRLQAEIDQLGVFGVVIMLLRLPRADPAGARFRRVSPTSAPRPGPSPRVAERKTVR